MQPLSGWQGAGREPPKGGRVEGGGCGKGRAESQHKGRRVEPLQLRTPERATMSSEPSDDEIALRLKAAK